MKKISLFLLVLSLAIAAGGGYLLFAWIVNPSPSSLPSQGQMAVVTRGDISTTVSASGNLSLYQAKLNFGTSGTLAEVKVKAGDSVAKGQSLARLDASTIASLEKAVSQARLNLAKAEEALETAKSPYSEKDKAQAESAIANARLAVQQAEDALETAKSPYSERDIAQAESAVANARLAVQQAEEALEKAKTPYSADEITAAEEAVKGGEQGVKNAEAELATTQEDWKSKVADGEEQLAQAAEKYKEALGKYFGIEPVGDEVYLDPQALLTKKGEDPQVAYAWSFLHPRPPARDDMLAEAETAWKGVIAKRNSLQSLTVQRDNALVAAQNKIAKEKDSLRQAQDNLSTMKEGGDPLEIAAKDKALALAKANLKKAEEDLAQMALQFLLAQQQALPLPNSLEVAAKDKALALAKANLNKAEEDLAAMVPDPLGVVSKEKALALAKANLKEVEEALAKMVPDPLDIELKEGELPLAKQALADAQAKLAQASLLAPFAGVVGSVPVEAGQGVSASTVIVTLVDPTRVWMGAVVDEIDLFQVRTGQRATLSLDALPNLQLEAKVASISPVGTSQQGVLRYTVTLDITPPSGVTLVDGLTTTASIVVESRANVLVVPSRAVRTAQGVRTVKVVENGGVADRVVTTGMSDGQQTEVLSGLNEGDIVVVQATSSTASTQTGSFGGMMPGGGMLPGGSFFGGTSR